MAGELTVNVQANLRNGPLVAQFPPGGIRVDQADAMVNDRVITVGFAAHEAITFGDIATVGYVGFHNLDGTNFVQVGVDDSGVFVPVIRLLPGETGIVPVDPGAALYAKADTADVDLRVCAFSR